LGGVVVASGVGVESRVTVGSVTDASGVREKSLETLGGVVEAFGVEAEGLDPISGISVASAVVAKGIGTCRRVVVAAGIVVKGTVTIRRVVLTSVEVKSFNPSGSVVRPRIPFESSVAMGCVVEASFVVVERIGPRGGIVPARSGGIEGVGTCGSIVVR